MSRIEREEVERVASLARLQLGPEEVGSLTGQLEAILSYVALLEEVDIEGVPATSHVLPMATPMRSDEPRGELSPERALANAPSAYATAFAVPRVLDDEATG